MTSKSGYVGTGTATGTHVAVSKSKQPAKKEYQANPQNYKHSGHLCVEGNGYAIVWNCCNKAVMSQGCKYKGYPGPGLDFPRKSQLSHPTVLSVCQDCIDIWTRLQISVEKSTGFSLALCGLVCLYVPGKCIWHKPFAGFAFAREAVEVKFNHTPNFGETICLGNMKVSLRQATEVSDTILAPLATNSYKQVLEASKRFSPELISNFLAAYTEYLKDTSFSNEEICSMCDFYDGCGETNDKN